MMKQYFSIGEMSKLFNLPVKTLRYYNEVGLLRPAYINPENHYRYYSVEQFITIDVIKNCKMMGMSLEEIKNLLDSNTSIEEVLIVVKKKIALIEEKLTELSQAKTYMLTLERNIAQVKEHKIGDIFIKYNEPRVFMKYDYRSDSSYELEMNLRKVFLHIEEELGGSYLNIGTRVSHDLIKSEGRVSYRELRCFSHYAKTDSVLPAGNYITLFYDANSGESKKYYRKLMAYIVSHELSVVGDFNETWIMPRMGEDQKEKTFTQIDILVQDSN